MSDFKVVQLADIKQRIASKFAPYIERALQLGEGEALVVDAPGSQNANYQTLLNRLRVQATESHQIHHPLRVLRSKGVVYLTKREAK